MAFIVSLFKYLILFVCFIILVGLILGITTIMDSSNPMRDAMTPWAIVGVLSVLVFLIVSLAGVAIIISIHDRHREIAEGVDRIAVALQHRNDAAAYERSIV